jgi:hypothetical protein
MVKEDQFDSLWQVKAGFVSQREPNSLTQMTKALPTSQPKRTNFKVNPLVPEGATDMFMKRQKQTNKRTQWTPPQAPTPTNTLELCDAR